MGDVGFLDVPEPLRAELIRYGIYVIGGGWVVELQGWLKALVHANPVSYMLDLLRPVTLGFSQLPMTADLAVVAGRSRCCSRPARWRTCGVLDHASVTGY